MLISFDDQRPSDSPYIERVWRAHSERSGTFLSVASSHWEIVVTRLEGRAQVTVRGPETRVREVHCPANGEWVAIRMKAGTFMPQWPVNRLLNGRDVNLPTVSPRSFRLDGASWELPGFDNAEVFVARLVKAGLVARDAAVQAALMGDDRALTTRTAERHFLQATGMTRGMLRQIERARFAATLLQQGLPIADAVHEAGYCDQPHLTRSLKRLIGLTPARIARGERQLSFLYKTTPADAR